MYILNDYLELTRQELVDLLVDIIEEDLPRLNNVLPLLPRYSVRENCKYRAVKIARAMGYKVVTIA